MSEKPLKVREEVNYHIEEGTSQGKGRQMKKCVREVGEKYSC